MSSILDALKKVETESGRQLGADDANAFSPRQALRRQLSTGPRIRTWMRVLPVCCLLLVAGLYYWIAHQSSSNPVSLVVAHSQPSGEMALPASPVVDPFAPPAKMALPVPHVAPVKPVVPPRISPPPLPEPVVSPPSFPEPAVSPIPQPADHAPPVPELAPFPQDGGLTLQALAWAPSPESRFAVINTRIVREGQQIEAVTVVRIEPEQVVLRQAGKLWQLRHRP